MYPDMVTDLKTCTMWDVFLYCCPDCPICVAHLSSIGLGKVASVVNNIEIESLLIIKLTVIYINFVYPQFSFFLHGTYRRSHLISTSLFSAILLLLY